MSEADEVRQLRGALSSVLLTTGHVAGSLRGTATPSEQHLSDLAGMLEDEVATWAPMTDGEPISDRRPFTKPLQHEPGA